MSTDRDNLIKQYLRGRVEVFGPTAFVAPSLPKNILSQLASENISAPAEQPAIIAPHAASEKPVKTKPPSVVKEDAAMFPTPEKIVMKEKTMATINELWTTASTLALLNDQICGCLKCPLGNTRTKFVFGIGNPQAKLVVIGEAPGKDEDEQGEPFVGRAGQLLNKILEAIQFKREDVFICNILKCRPPGNRDPLPAEVEQCEPYLHKQLDLLQPKLILALGRIAANTLLKTNLSLRDLRSSLHEFHGIPMMATYHPAALLRNPAWKKDTWEDVQKLRAMYDKLLSES